MLNLSPARRVFAGFAIYSFAMGNIFPRLADVQTGMGVTTAELGLGLIGAPIGTLLALTFATPWLEKWGFGRVLPPALPLVALLYAVAVHAPSPFWLFLGLMPTGFTIGCVEIMLNAEADRTEHRICRRIMNRSHAFWSIGFFTAGLFGAQIAGLGLSAQWHLALVVPMVALASFLALSGYEPSPARDGGAGGKVPHFAIPTPAILLLVLVTVPAVLLEGASMDWSAIYMRDAFAEGRLWYMPQAFQTDEVWQGLGVASFAVAQGGMRFFADGVVERTSPAALARVLYISLLIGCVVVVASPFPLLSLAGFAAMGFGTSAIFPLAVSAAARRTDRPSALNIAAFAQFAFMLFLIGPPLLGMVAHDFGIRTTFAIALPLIFVSLLTAGALGRR